MNEEFIDLFDAMLEEDPEAALKNLATLMIGVASAIGSDMEFNCPEAKLEVTLKKEENNDE